MNILSHGLTLGLVAALAACGSTPSVTVNSKGAPLARQITAADHCGLTAPGLVHIENTSELSKFRQLPQQNLNLPAADTIDFDSEHLLVVGLGQKPTGGYSVTLTSYALHGEELDLGVVVNKPDPQMMVPQVITTPCAVLAISAGGWQTLDVNGDGLDEMTVSR
ncbi:MAG: protease complex subunit PrcB family protein [Marinobacter sp.]|uniref:protease complex subunit PrcB family protein n=1 Tax=Marinobacter sp. TaxID=50741 RepID=UPI00299EB205|nr:protease complex subunit PrcB family protein [Marinobacter sp.]MDX1635261.1 protease complex subunit PrcB family protein [Marinobacter sp.]